MRGGAHPVKKAAVPLQVSESLGRDKTLTSRSASMPACMHTNSGPGFRVKRGGDGGRGHSSHHTTQSQFV